MKENKEFADLTENRVFQEIQLISYSFNRIDKKNKLVDDDDGTNIFNILP